VEGLESGTVRTRTAARGTGSGKTFTNRQRHPAGAAPGDIHGADKTLAAQLYGEFREFFFPNNSVETSFSN